MIFREWTERDYGSFLKLYNDSFPSDERRIYNDISEISTFVENKKGKFNCFVCEEDGVFIGFITYWKFDGYVYVEHFAIDPLQRGKNIGSKMLNHLIDTCGGKVLLEVELPEDEMSRRRIGFYERHGFKTREDIYYIQPAYSAEQNGMQLLLMTLGEVKLESTKDLREMLHEVYGYNI